MKTPAASHLPQAAALFALLLTAIAGCGRVSLIPLQDLSGDAVVSDAVALPDADTAADARDGQTVPDGAIADAVAAQDAPLATGDIAGRANADTAPTDAGPPPTFSGTAEVGFAPHKNGPPGNLLIVTVKVAQAALPQPARSYVLWMTGPGTPTKNFGALPVATDFSISAPPPPIGAKDPIGLYNGALVSYEPTSAVLSLKTPTGPKVWQGQVPTEVWQHVQHVLVKGPKGGKGYAQQAAMITAEVEKQLSIAVDLLGSGEKDKARATVEIMHNLMAGPQDVYDLDKNGQIIKDIIDVQVGLPGTGGAAALAIAHAQLAADAAPANAALQAGLSALQECEKPLVEKATKAIELTAAFASGVQGSLSPTTLAVSALREQTDCLVMAAGKLPVIALQLAKD